MMAGAVAAQVLLASAAAVGPRDHVIEFGIRGSSTAAGSPAVHVAGPDVVGEPGGWVVGGAAVVELGAREQVGEVSDGLCTEAPPELKEYM